MYRGLLLADVITDNSVITTGQELSSVVTSVPITLGATTIQIYLKTDSCAAAKNVRYIVADTNKYLRVCTDKCDLTEYYTMVHSTPDY